MSSNLLSGAVHSGSVLHAPEIAAGVFTDTSSRDIAVSVRGLSKSYSIAKNAEKHSTLGEALISKLKNPLLKPERNTFWALNDVNFDIRKGDVVGIIGRNGAGKSTLLKVLSRITEPTKGKIDLYGRVGSLLEVGTGFHPELTGRENVYLNGAILGMKKSEIARQFDAIVDFSGTEQFLDTPVKRYSSGMYVRLAFAVAAHLNPEILIVDEVLAVGDAEFQKKCLGKMKEVSEGGRTVIFVSHNIQAVRTLCSRAIYLRGGRVAADRDVEAGVKDYLSFNNMTLSSQRVWDDPADRPGDDLFQLTALRVLDQNGAAAVVFDSNHPVLVEMDFDLAQDSDQLCVGFDLTTNDGQSAFRTYQTDLEYADRPRLQTGRNRLRCVIPAGLLNAGSYMVNVRVSIHQQRWIAEVDGPVQFDVLLEHGSAEFVRNNLRPGPIAPVLPWSQV